MNQKSQPGSLLELRVAYTRGTVTGDESRALRRAMLTAMAAGSMAPSPLPRPVSGNTTIVSSAPQILAPMRPPGRPTPKVPAAAQSRPNVLKWAIGGGASVIVVALAALLLHDDGQPPPQDATPPPVASAPAAGNDEAPDAALARFADTPDWSQAGIRKAEEALASTRLMSDQEAAAAVVRRVHDVVAQRIDEEMAAPAVSADEDLLALASSLDIDTSGLRANLLAKNPVASAPAGQAPLPVAGAPPTPDSTRKAFDSKAAALAAVKAMAQATASTPATSAPEDVGPATNARSASPDIAVPAVTKASSSEAATAVAGKAPPKQSPGTQVAASTDPVKPANIPPSGDKPADAGATPKTGAPPAAAKASPRAPEAVARQPQPEAGQLAQAKPLTPPTAAVAPKRAEQKAGTVAVPASVATTAAPATATSPQAATPQRANGCDTAMSRFCQDAWTNGSGPQMVRIPAGRFSMGGERPEERPIHEVAIRRKLAVGKYEVSQLEYQQFSQATNRTMPAQPRSGPGYPVVGITWHDARAYTEWLSELTGATYRLPSESEWEYFARAGETTRWPSSDENFNAASIVSSELGTKSGPELANRGAMNAFKVTNVLGNAAEWVADTWRDDHSGAGIDERAVVGDGKKVARGGSFADRKLQITFSARAPYAAETQSPTIGFRVVRELN